MKTILKNRLNMRKIIVLFLFLACFGNIAKSQDVITLKNGEEIRAKVTEIETYVIKYKKFENLTGPVYSIEKAKVFTIKYENGTKDVISPIENTTINNQNSSSGELVYRGGKIYKENVKLRASEVKSTMAINPEALNKYKSGRGFNIAGWIFTGAGVIQLTTALVLSESGADATYQYALAIVDCGLGLTCQIISSSQYNKSVTIYNSGIKKQSLVLGITHDGIGLCLKF